LVASSLAIEKNLGVATEKGVVAIQLATDMHELGCNQMVSNLTEHELED
jgi:hypothetical protein